MASTCCSRGDVEQEIYKVVSELTVRRLVEGPNVGLTRPGDSERNISRVLLGTVQAGSVRVAQLAAD